MIANRACSRSESALAYSLGSKLLVLFLALTVVGQAEYRKPTVAQADRVSLGQGLNGGDLERLKIGNQAGLLKVLGPKDEVLFVKGSGSLAGIDGREWAPLSPEQRDAIVRALGISDADKMARSLLTHYPRVSRAHALALLGVLAHPGAQTASLKPHLRKEVLSFARGRLQPAEDNLVRRQAVLLLAIQPSTDATVVQAMLNFLRRDHNAWNTFGVVQFFELHKDQILKMPGYQGYLTQIQSSGSPLAEQILTLLVPANSSE